MSRERKLQGVYHTFLLYKSLKLSGRNIITMEAFLLGAIN